MMRQVMLNSPHELGAGPRLGGLFNPKTDTSAIWKGRPPTTLDGLTPNVLCISLQATAPIVGGATYSATIEAQGGTSNGDKISRVFSVGLGVSADLGIGAFPHVNVRAVTPIPPNMDLYFSWVNDLTFSSSQCTLTNFLSYPAANVITAIPEGAFDMTPEVACQITFQVTQFSTTFVVGAAAGEPIPVRWGSFTCNVPNQFFFRLRGF